MNTGFAAWLGFSAIAAIILFNLARRLQGRLHGLLHENLENQRDWLKKKAKATFIAKRTVRQKAVEEAAFLESREATLAQVNQIASEAAAAVTPAQEVA